MRVEKKGNYGEGGVGKGGGERDTGRWGDGIEHQEMERWYGSSIEIVAN